MTDPIIHESLLCDGPLTYEYRIGSSIPAEHLECLSPFVRDAANKTVVSIREQLATGWNKIHPVISPIASYLSSMEICSVAFTESSDEDFESWIVFRGSASDQCLLGSPFVLPGEIAEASWITSINGLRPLLTEFGNLQVGSIPSCSGFGTGDRLIHESDDDLCWGETGKWENALPIFSDGACGTVCVSTDGTIGLWTPHQFQTIAESLSEFVTMFVKRYQSGQSPTNEWWW